MRIELAKVLLRKPDIFLFDEPTNHLDIESIQWFEDFLAAYKGAAIIISHDKAFLDNVTSRTIEISLGKAYDYRVPYSKYVVLRKEQREQQMATYLNQQKMIDDTERFIERFRSKASKAVQVQSRIKQLAKVERIVVEEEDKSAMHFRFPAAPRSGTIAMEAEDMSKRYGNLLVLDKVSIVVERGEKISLVGRNGEGKSTMLKVITGDITFEGNVKIGHNIKIGYYAQNQPDLLDINKTVLQTIDDVAVGEIRTKIRDILGSFLFSGEDCDKKVKVLSGGERSRLSLAKMLLEPVNLLILDEPTNHLDMKSKEILKNALLQYDGTLILVSHDRDFLDGLVTKVYEFSNKKIKQHIGGIYDFLRKKKLANLKDIEKKEQLAKENPEEKISSNKLQYFEKKEQEKEIRKVKSQITKIEDEIGNLENELKTLATILSEPEKLPEGMDFNTIYMKHEQIKKEINSKEMQWERLHYEAEILESKK
jgi:ATP-binding cassette subfamily F protein 3